MFAEIIYICNKCNQTFSVADTTSLKSDNLFISSLPIQKIVHSCPKCLSTSTEKLVTNLENRKK